MKKTKNYIWLVIISILLCLIISIFGNNEILRLAINLILWSAILIIYYIKHNKIIGQKASITKYGNKILIIHNNNLSYELFFFKTEKELIVTFNYPIKYMSINGFQYWWGKASQLPDDIMFFIIPSFDNLSYKDIYINLIKNEFNYVIIRKIN